VDFGKIADDHLEIFHEGFGKDSHGLVMLHGGPTKLKNHSWRHDAPLFQSGLPKTFDFGKIADDHLEIDHEGFEKDSHGRVMLHGGPTKLKKIVET
jgi:MOSC domain-containing protein YiiM